MGGSAQPVAIPPVALGRWLLLAPLFLLLIYLVGLDQGEVSRVGQLLHELLHDGRHFLAVPCH
jgi:hypothetical protein